MKINLNTQRTLSLIYQLRYLSYDAFKSFPLHFLFSPLICLLIIQFLCLCVHWLMKKICILLYYLIIFSSRLFTQTLLLHLLWFLFYFAFFMKKTKKKSISRFSFIKFLELILWIFSDPFKNRVRFKCICVYTYIYKIEITGRLGNDGENSMKE